MRRRHHCSERIARLDPVADAQEISTLLSKHEFPWDIHQALSFALFRTYAVPSIGRLLSETGQFTGDTQRRYDDTVLLLDHVLSHGLASGEGRRAVRRINQMHAMYAIGEDDMRYVLSTFVVVPKRWLDDYGWRPLTEHELVATTTYYRELGRHMGIPGTPTSYAGFERLMDDYEAAHFAYDDGARAVADATLNLMATFPPNSLAPRPVARRFAYALMDQPLLDAFGYPTPTAAERVLARQALRTRGRLLRLAPPRMTPKPYHAMPGVTRRDGYDPDALGTFAATGDPALHRRPLDRPAS